MPNALANPLLELHDAQGNLTDSNDDWANSTGKQTIESNGLAPSDSHESALSETLSAGNYTAIVRGVDDATGVAVVEIYQLD